MSESTKAFYHTDTTSQTNIGPASGGVLHSITYANIGGGDTIIVRDGSNIIFTLMAGQTTLQNKLSWKGLELDGQLSLELSSAGIKTTVEMSQQL